MQKSSKIMVLSILVLIFLIAGPYYSNASDESEIFEYFKKSKFFNNVVIGEHNEDENEDGEERNKEDDDEDGDEEKYEKYEEKSNKENSKEKEENSAVYKESRIQYQDEEEFEEDDEKHGEENVTKEIIQNSDGTTTEIFTKTKKGETEIKEITYDANGNKIMVKETEQEEGEEEIKVKTFDIYGNKLSEVKIKSDNGSVLKIKVKEGVDSYEGYSEEDGQETKVIIKYDAKNEKLVIHNVNPGEGTETQSKLIIETSGEGFRITRSGHSVETSFPMTVDEETGQITIETSVGTAELKFMPDTIVETAETEERVDIVESSMIEEENGKVRYVLEGVKFEKLLGVFTVEINTKTKYDAETGQFVEEEKPFFTTVLDLFSF